MARTMTHASTRPGRRLRRGSSRRSGGFVMLEALVGGLIFAVGVLGVVGLQASMTQAQTIGKFRGDATYLASELVGLLWTDLPNRNSYNTAQCSSYARCSDWTAKVGRALPGGATTVVVNATTGVVTISISWTTSAGVQVYTTTSAVTA